MSRTVLVSMNSCHVGCGRTSGAWAPPTGCGDESCFHSVRGYKRRTTGAADRGKAYLAVKVRREASLHRLAHRRQSTQRHLHLVGVVGAAHAAALGQLHPHHPCGSGVAARGQGSAHETDGARGKCACDKSRQQDGTLRAARCRRSAANGLRQTWLSDGQPRQSPAPTAGPSLPRGWNACGGAPEDGARFSLSTSMLSVLSLTLRAASTSSQAGLNRGLKPD
jgi:hypothetical protein